MWGASALRRLLFAEVEEGAVDQRRRYHFSTTYDGLLSNILVDHRAGAVPDASAKQALLCSTVSAFGCITMRARNKERWWFALLVYCAGYFGAAKAHQSGNGLFGHQIGFWLSFGGCLGSIARVLNRYGTKRGNLGLLSLFGLLMWYEYGRYHLWEEHCGELKREVKPERTYDLFAEFCPIDIDIPLVRLRNGV